MSDKQQFISMLKDEFQRWLDLPAGMSEEETTVRRLPSQLSIKDIYAHLMAWQQQSIARVEAAVENREPKFPAWPENLDPDEEEDLEKINAWIHETYRDWAWDQVYRDWRSGFTRFIDLAEKVPERDLLEVGRYRWLKEYPLSLILLSSYEHHHEEHLGPLLEWLNKPGES